MSGENARTPADLRVLASIPGASCWLLRLSAGERDLGKRRQISVGCRLIVAAQHDEPQKHRKESPGHDPRTASPVQIRFKTLAFVYSDRLIEVTASVLVSEAEDASTPVQPTSRESRLADSHPARVCAPYWLIWVPKQMWVEAFSRSSGYRRSRWTASTSRRAARSLSGPKRSARWIEASVRSACSSKSGISQSSKRTGISHGSSGRRRRS